MPTSVVVAQVPVSWDTATNRTTFREVLDETRPGEVVVLPEGLLSGYGDDLSPLDSLDPDEVTDAVRYAAGLAERKQVDVFCGTLLPVPGGWCNAGLYFPACGAYQEYRKVNLAVHERGRLVAGDRLPTYDVAGAGTVGMQLCREIRFPEQWQHLAAAGAQLFVYLTNAANSREPAGVWRSHLISRAAENQRFLVSANIAHPDQHCPSLVLSPRGEVLGELPAGRPGLLRHTLDLTEARDWYLGQRRRDVVAVTYQASPDRATPGEG